ncbi:Vacuolar protein sorting-associated protein 36 [Diplonema papillatum]|nr:Vacuolar protein sorting-associated protein 36 [Diplonema papillatum]
MDAFKQLPPEHVTTAGRPLLCAGETQLLLQDGVGFYDGEVRSRYENGTLYLSTHRLLWISESANNDDKPAGIYLPMAELSAEPTKWLGFGYLSHPKLVFCVKSTGRTFKISFRKYGMENFRAKLHNAVQKAAWLKSPVPDYKSLEKPQEGTAKKKEVEDIVAPASSARLAGEARLEGDFISHLGGRGKKQISTATFSFSAAAAGPYDAVINCQGTGTFTVSVNSGEPVLCTVESKRSITKTLPLHRGTNSVVVTQPVSIDEQCPLVGSVTFRPLFRAHQAKQTSIGLSSVVQRLEDKDKSEASTLDDAFKDIDALMGMTKEVTDLMRSMQDKVTACKAESAGTEDEIEAQQDMLNSWVADLGMLSLVTKESVGLSDYHNELARQLLDFLQEALRRQNGTLTLVDAFCLFNRARGTDLVSPDDLVKACKRLEHLKRSNIRMAKIGSGNEATVILRLDDMAGDSKLLELLPNAAAFVTALSLAANLRVSNHVATEILNDAEERGLLCRDEQSAEAVSFYCNPFK